MKAFVYQAALLCQACGEAAKLALADTLIGLDGREPEDSGEYPQGPYGAGGGEADCPQHCDHCHMFLENPLTGDGDAYVREAALPFSRPGTDESWEEVAVRAEEGGKPVVAEWIRYYLAWGQ